MTEPTTCAICGGHLGATLLEISEPDRFELRCGVGREGYRRRWVECDGCGTSTNVLPAVSRRALTQMRASYYEVDLASGDIGAKYTRVMAMKPGESDNWGRVERIVAFCGRWLEGATQPRVLDIGAGTGVFLSRFLEATQGQWDAIGLEPDPLAATHLRELGRFAVIEAMFSGQSELCGFSLVTLNKVLEHIEEPVPLLLQASRALEASRGLLYVELPDKLTIGRRPQNDNILGALHCHLYHPASVGTLFRQAGLETLAIGRVIEPSGKITVYGFACLPQRLEHV